MDNDNDDSQLWKQISWIGGIIIVIIVVIASGFDTIEPIEWGLKHNSITK